MPRLECAFCSRSIAAGIVAGGPGKGRLWRHDPTVRPEIFGDAHVSCPGSLEIVDLPAPGAQLALDLGLDDGVPDEAPGIDTIALF